MTTSNTTPPPLDPQALTAAEVREHFSYNPVTGDLLWAERGREHFQTEHGWLRFNEDRAGKPAGTAHKLGRVVTYRGVRFPAAQLAWLYAEGRWPDRDIDFADGDPLNIALDNLVESDLPFVVGVDGPVFRRMRDAQRAARGLGKTAKPVKRAAKANKQVSREAWEAQRKALIEEHRARLLSGAADLL